MIEKTIKEYKSMVDSRLRVFIKERISKAEKISPHARDMMEQILEFNMRGGKRIRPILVIFGYRAVGCKLSDAIIEAALAVELMEAFLLVHDDIMDQDELRRGYLTMHKTYENRCSRSYKTNARRYGESMALIIGDILAIMGSEAILNSRFPLVNKLKAIEMFNRAVINTCFGQMLDIRSGFDPSVNMKDISQVNRLKTAVYTFYAPLAIGAHLGNATDSELAIIKDYAMPLGQSYQLQDDILGLFGTRQKIGKPVGSDIRAGKKTIMIMKTVENADATQKKFIQRCLGNQDATDVDIEKLKDIVKSVGAYKYTLEQARILADMAKNAVKQSRLKPNGKEFLLGLVDYVVNREY